MLDFFIGYIVGGLLTGVILISIYRHVHEKSGTLYVDREDPKNLYLEFDNKDAVYLPMVELQVKHISSRK